MADRTTQPATEVGPHSAYAANCRFLWNAAVPNKNSLNSNDSTSGLKGTDHTGSAGKYRTFGADGQLTFAVTFPTGAYTLVVVHAFPTASIGSTQTVTTASGTGFQCTPYTTGGGVYENYTHRGVADSTQNQVTGVAGFDTAPWVEVFAWSGAGGSPANQLRRYRKSGSGVETQGTETVSYVAPSTTIYLGSSLAANTQGVYAVMLVDGDIGATECELLRDNPWRMFAEEGGAAPIAFTGTVPTINFTIGTADSVDLSAYFSGTETPFTYGLDGASSALPSGVTLSSAGLLEWSGSGTAGTTTGVIVQGTDQTPDTADTNSFSIVIAAPAENPVITGQPSNATVKRGQTATFTVTATGSGTVTYQWQRNPGGVGSWADISGATSASYTTPATTISGGSANDQDDYRCNVSDDDAGPVATNVVTLTVQQCVLALSGAGYEFGDGNDIDTLAVLASTELQVAAYPLTEWPPASAVATATATTGSNGRLADLGDDDLVFGTTYRVIARNAADGKTWAWTMAAS